ncbi:MAG: YHYH domain-containing protein [Alphaproteobacteria bacterium]|nr:YHYH domain-containing protein [Alphaproteobacteria bacterium]
MRALLLALIAAAVFTPTTIHAHGGGLDDKGCHHDRKRGDYHCHRGAPPPRK